jgi:hypothetical protein
MRMVRATLLIAIAVATAGCYRWVPYEGPPVPAGTDVRLRLTNTASDSLRRVYGPNDGTISGPLARWNDANVSVLTETLITRPGFAATVLADTIHVSAFQMVGVDLKQLDKRKTGFLSAGIVAGALGLVFATRAFGGDSNDNEGGGPPIDESLIVRIPIRIGR